MELNNSQSATHDRSVVMTTNELLAFVEVTGLADIRGVDADLEQIRMDPSGARRVQLGVESLVRRGLVTLDAEGGGEFTLLVRALLGSAATPDSVITLARIPSGAGAGAALTLHLMSTPELALSCEARDRDTWLFTAIFPPFDVRGVASDFLLGMTPIDQPPQYAPARLPVTDFAQLLTEVNDETATNPQNALVKAGLSSTAADDLLDDMRTRTSWTCVVVRNLREQNPLAMEAVTVINAATHCWLVRAVESDSGAHVEISAVTAATCLAAALSLVDAALKQPEPEAAFAGE